METCFFVLFLWTALGNLSNTLACTEQKQEQQQEQQLQQQASSNRNSNRQHVGWSSSSGQHQQAASASSQQADSRQQAAASRQAANIWAAVSSTKCQKDGSDWDALGQALAHEGVVGLFRWARATMGFA